MSRLRRLVHRLVGRIADRVSSVLVTPSIETQRAAVLQAQSEALASTEASLRAEMAAVLIEFAEHRRAVESALAGGAGGAGRAGRPEEMPAVAADLAAESVEPVDAAGLVTVHVEAVGSVVTVTDALAALEMIEHGTVERVVIAGSLDRCSVNDAFALLSAARRVTAGRGDAMFDSSANGPLEHVARGVGFHFVRRIIDPSSGVQRMIVR
jgi:hypothetical protein